jgi:hypothetical protein
MRQIRNLLALLLLAGLLVGGCVWRYSKWRADSATEEKRWEKRCAHAHDAVVGSRLYSKDLRDELASDYLERISKTGTCDWFYDPMWRSGRKNPNWFSQTAGSDGVHVRCETSAESADDQENQLVFEWDVSDYRGIEGFRWGYNPIQLDDEQ